MAKLERTDKPVSVFLEELGEGALGVPEIQRSYVVNPALYFYELNYFYEK